MLHILDFIARKKGENRLFRGALQKWAEDQSKKPTLGTMQV